MPPRPRRCLRRLTDRLAPLERDLHRAFWTRRHRRPPGDLGGQAAGRGGAAGRPRRLELFAEVQEALAAAGTRSAATRRALEQANLDLLANQIPEGDRAELVALQAKVEHAFATVRGRVGDRELANNELERVLADPTTRPSGAPPGRPASRSGRPSPTTCSPWSSCATAWPASAATATGSPSPWPPATSTRPGWSGSWRRSSGHPRAVPGRQGRARRPPERPLRGRRRRLRPWHYGDLFFQRYDGEAEADLGPLLEGADTVGSPSPPTTAWAWRPATCWSGPTCTPVPARTSTPSAWTSTGPATSGCWPTWPPARSGWTCCCTRSATPSTTTTSTARCPGCSAARPSRWSPRRWP